LALKARDTVQMADKGPTAPADTFPPRPSWPIAGGLLPHRTAPSCPWPSWPIAKGRLVPCRKMERMTLPLTELTLSLGAQAGTCNRTSRRDTATRPSWRSVSGHLQQARRPLVQSCSVGGSPQDTGTLLGCIPCGAIAGSNCGGQGKDSVEFLHL
jgi:hypothetical protein